MFTSKHMKAIAAVLDGLTVEEVRGTRTYSSPIPHLTFDAYTLVEALCEMLAETNPRFDRKRFIEACGFKPWDELIMGQPFTKEELQG